MNFFKGIAIGLGAVAPGLSGSILLVIFGLYQKTINAISTLFKKFKANMLFLLPLGLGILVGIVLFSKLVDWLLGNAEMYTRFGFLGLILGSVPLFYREVKKEGFKNRYYFVIAASFAVGFFVFNFNSDLFPTVIDPSFFQSAVLGLVVAASYIVPGIDSAAVLSTLGLYELWVKSLADLDFKVLLPAAIGVAVGALSISFIISFLIKKCYTSTFSVIFGLFLSVIPGVINESCALGLNLKTLFSLVLLVVCFFLSLAFSNMDKIKAKYNQKKKLS